MVATDFVTDKALRDRYIDKVEVLDKIENVQLLTPLPSTEYVTMSQIADFYQVPLDTVKKCYQRHEDEICSDGVITLTPKMFKEFTNGTNCPFSKNIDYEQYRTHMIIHIDNNLDVLIPNRGIKVFPRRAALRFGMLLQESYVAKQVRTYLLDTEGYVYRLNTTISDNGANLFINCIQANGLEERLRVLYEFARYKDIQIAQRDKQIALLEEKIKNLYQLQQLTDSKSSNREQKVYGSKEVEIMRRRFSKVIRLASKKLKIPYSMVYNDVYTLLDYDYDISLHQRRRDDPKEQKIIYKEQQGISVNHIPLINYLKDNEWGYLYKYVKKHFTNCGINSETVIAEVRNADKKTRG